MQAKTDLRTAPKLISSLYKLADRVLELRDHLAGHGVVLLQGARAVRPRPHPTQTTPARLRTLKSTPGGLLFHMTESTEV